MATVNDIDTKAVVNRFLSRQVLTPRNDDEADTEEEITALLQSVAISFLLFPQIALPLLLRARNSLRQVVQADLDVLDFIRNAIRDLDNPDLPVDDQSDLIEAQTALVELDRLQRVDTSLQAFQRYNAAINRFLDQQLAPSLKRKARGEFERNGTEARADIFGILPQFGPTHRVMANRLADLQGAISDLRSVNLEKIVSTRTLSLVRSSLDEVRSRFENEAISKTTAAVELLGGSAALSAISQTGDVFDPTVDTGSLPASRTIRMRAEDGTIQASALSSAGPWTVGATPWDFDITLNAFSGNPVSFSLELPAPGVEGSVYVTSSLSQSNFSIPSNGTLYLRAEGAGTEEQEVSITSGTRTLSEVITDLNAGLVDVTAAEFGDSRIILYGAVGVVTSLTVRGGSSGAAGSGFNSDPSIHDILGFETNQQSLPLGQFTASSLKDALETRLPGATLEVEDDSLRITSNLDDPLKSSVRFDGGIESSFGFNGLIEAQPSYLVLTEDEEEVEPESLGVFVGSKVTVTEDPLPGSTRRSLNQEPITQIDNNRLLFASSSLPRSTGMSVTIKAPIVDATQELIEKLEPYVGSFDSDSRELQQVMSPLISRPTRAQVNDAIKVIEDIRSRVSDVLTILDSIVIREDQSAFSEAAERVIFSLEERGLDRAQTLLTTGRFSQFFTLSKENASRSSRFLSSMESFVTTDIPTSTIEEDINEDVRITGSNPDDDVLPGKELSDTDELVPEID